MPALIADVVTGGKTQELVQATEVAGAAANKAAVEADPIRQLDAQKKLEDDAAGKMAADQAAQKSQRMKKKPMMGGVGRSGTILTSPLGQVGGSDPGVGRKTILGG